MWKYVTFLDPVYSPLKKLPILSILPILLFLASAAQARELELEIGGKNYRIELAQTSSERRLGLMFRERLADDAGMLLVYRESGDHRIWMKNVKIPLRVYWINAAFEVVDAQRLDPCAADPCPVYSARGESRFVLELSDDPHDLGPGDVIDGLADL